MKQKIPAAITIAPRGYSFHGKQLSNDELGTVTPTEIDTSYEEAISEDRYKVVQAGLLWRIKIGDGIATYGRFYSRQAAEDMASLFRREFLNGAFTVRKRDAQLSSLGCLIADGAKKQPTKGEPQK